MLAEQLEDRRMLATVVWDGGGDDAFWSTPANWTNNVAPVSGDQLEFPSGAARLANTNNFATGTAFDSIVFTDAGYTLTGNSIGLANGIDNQSAGTNTFNVPLELTGSQTIQTDGALDIQGTIDLGTHTLTLNDETIPGMMSLSGMISGSGGITKTGSVSRVRLLGDNTYSGITQILEGTIDIFHDEALGAASGATSLSSGATLVLNGVTTAEPFNIGSATITGFGTLSGPTTILANSPTFLSQSNHVLTVSGNITDNGAGHEVRLRPFGADSSVVLSGTGAWSGQTSVSGSGTLRLNAADAIPDASRLFIGSDSPTIVLDGFDETIGSLHGTVGEIDLGTRTLTTGGNELSDDFGGLISGSGGLTKIGTGTQTLSGSNTYSGATSINAGTLYDSGGFGGAIPNGSAVAIASGATLSLDPDIGFDGIGSLAGEGDVVLNGSVSLQNGGDGQSTAFSGVIRGGGHLTQNGSGTLTLSGVNSYTGGTGISAGSIRIGASGAIPDVGEVAVNSGTTLDLNGFDETIGRLRGQNGGGEIALGGGTLTTGDASSSTYNGVISGTGGLVKQGSGIFTLSGANTYTGVTTVQSGRLNMDGSLADGPAASDVVVASGATLGGSGTVNGAVQLNSTAMLSPGSSPGRLTTGDLRLTSGSTFFVEIDGATASTEYDQIVANGTVDLGGATLDAARTYAALLTDTFLIIDNVGSDSVTGTFNGLVEGGVVAIDGTNFQISYLGGDGNDVTLTPMPNVVKGAKFEDLNANGVRDPGEPGLAGWTIFVDTNGNRVLDTGEISDTTDSDGVYTISNVPAGSVDIVEVGKSGWVASLPAPVAASLVEPNPPILARTGISNTTLSGDITADTTLTKAAGPYLITTPVTISGSVTLTVEPGAEVLFAPGAQLVVEGELSAVGTSAAPILFTSSAATPAKGDWNGIDIRNTQGGHVVLEFVTLEYSSTGIQVECCSTTSPAVISDSVFRHNQSGVGGYSGAKVIIERTVFDSNTYGVSSVDKQITDSLFANNAIGIRDGGRTTVWTSTFRNNTIGITGASDMSVYYSRITNNATGVEASFYAGPRLYNNEISNNDIGAILGSGRNDAITVEGNSFHDNTTLNLKTFGTNNKVAANNYWGVTDSAGINATIEDAREDIGLGLVSYEPILTAAPEVTPLLAGSLPVSVSRGETLSNVDFGNYQLTTVSGVKFDDINGDGIKDAGESGLEGWTIYIDTNDNGQLDNFEHRVATASDGTYAFTNLTPGSYRLREVGRAGWINTLPATGFVDLSTTSGSTITDIDFGNHETDRPAPVEIHGVKFNDLDADGIQDAGEPGLSDWTIFLDLNNNRQKDTGEPSTTTADDGSYSFTNLAAGTYSVGEVPQASWQQSFPALETPAPPAAPATTTIDHATISTATTVNGALFEDTTWSLADSPVRVTGDVLVFPDTTLSIDPGVVVLFDSGTRLTVRGHLDAVGTDAAPILLTSSSATPAMNDWNGIQLENTIGGTAELGFVALEYANTAFQVSCCTNSIIPATISDSTFRHNSLVFGGYSGGDVEVFRSLFENNTTVSGGADRTFYDSIFRNNVTALYDADRHTIVNSLFENNDVAISAHASTLVEYSTITGNRIGVTAPAYNGPNLRYNNITANEIGIELTAQFSTAIATNNIFDNAVFNAQNLSVNDRNLAGNYWGTQSALEIANSVHDSADDGSVGTVTVDPYSLQELDATPPEVGFHSLTLGSGEIAVDANFGNFQKITASFSDTTASADEDAGVVQIVAQLAQPLPFDTTVPVTFSGTADLNFDYFASDPNFFFPAGSTTGTLTLAIDDDLRFEGANTVVLTMQPGVGVAPGGTPVHTLTINDNDAIPELSFFTLGVTAAEDAGPIVIEARILAESEVDIRVPILLSGTATNEADDSNDADYAIVATPEILIPAGSLRGSIPLTIIDDTRPELTERIVAEFGTPVGATLSTAVGDPLTHVITIPQNDVPNVSFTASQGSFSENGGQLAATVRLSEPHVLPVTVPYTLVNGLEVTAGDYSVSPIGSIVIAAGETEGVITLTGQDDIIDENNENVTLRLGEPTNAVLGTTRSFVGTIIDDDTSILEFSSSGTTVWENAGPQTVTLTLTPPSATDVTVLLYTTGVKSTGSSRDFDISTTSITFTAGQTSKTLTVDPYADSHNEGDEYGYVRIANSDGVKIGNQDYFRLKIRDDDPYVYMGEGSSISERNQTSTSITMRLTASSNRTVTVPLSYAGSSAGRNRDFTGPSSVTFSPGQTSKTFTIKAKNDSIDEYTEKVKVSIAPPTNATTSSKLKRSETVSVYDDDAQPVASFKVTSYERKEGQGAWVEVRLSRASGKTITVPIGISRYSTATTSDHNFRNRTLTFKPGETIKSFQVRITNDSRSENRERLLLFLSSNTKNAVTDKSRNLFSVYIVPSDACRVLSSSSSNAETVSGTLAVNPRINLKTIGDCRSGFGSSINLSQIPVSDRIFNGQLAVNGGYVVDGTAFFDANFNGIVDYLDLNDNGIQDEGEPSEPVTTTLQDGSFSLDIDSAFDVDGNETLDRDEGRFVLIGGTDGATQLPFVGQFSSVPGQLLLSSISSTIQHLTQLGFDIPQASERVVQAMGMPDGMELDTLDLFEATMDGNADAAVGYARSAELFNATVDAASLFSAAPGAPPSNLLVDLAYAEIALRIQDAGSEIDLANESTVRSLLEGIGFRTGITLSADVIDGAASLIARGNLKIRDLPVATDAAFVEDIVRVEAWMQGALATDLQAVAGGSTDIATVLAAYAGAALDTAVANTPVGDIEVPVIFVNDVVKTEGDDGTTSFDFTVSLTSASKFPVSVDYQTNDDTAEAADGDYTPTSGTLNWAPGESGEQTVSVVVSGDEVAEADERFLLNLFDAENAIVRREVGAGFIINDDAVDYTATHLADQTENQFVVALSEEDVFVIEDDVEVFGGFQAEPWQALLTGQDDIDDTLFLDFSAGTYRSDTITFDGGGGTGFDSAIVSGGDFDTVTVSLTNATDGQTVFDPADSVETVTLNWLGLEPFTFNSVIADMVFELPAGVTSAVLEDMDPTDLVSPGVMRLYSPNSDFEEQIFPNPSGSLTIRGGDGTDTISIASLDPAFTGALNVDADFLGSDDVNVAVDGAINAIADFAVEATSITVNQPITLTDFDVRLAASGDLILNSPIESTNRNVELSSGTTTSVSSNITGNIVLSSGTFDLSNGDNLIGQVSIQDGATVAGGDMIHGNVHVASGGTLAGNQTVTGLITVADGGTLSPGAVSPSGIGTIQASAVKLLPGSLYHVDILWTDSGFSDKIITSAMSNQDGKLSVTLTGSPDAGETFQIIDIRSDAGADETGTVFQGLSEGAIFATEASLFQISYGGDAANYTLTAVAANTVTGTTPSLAAGVIAAGTTELTIDFSRAVDASAGTAPYVLQSVGPDGLLGNDDDLFIDIDSATYDGDSVTLAFAALPESVYRLTIDPFAGIAAIQVQVDEQTGVVNDLQGEIDVLSVLEADLTGQIDQAESELFVTQNTIPIVEGEMNDLQTQQQDVQSLISDQLQQLDIKQLELDDAITNNAPQPEIDRLQTELSDLQSVLDDLLGQDAVLQSQIDDKQTELANLQQRANYLQNQIHQLIPLRDEAIDRRFDMESQLPAEQTQLDLLQQQLANTPPLGGPGGDPIDGDGDGVAGGDFVADFVVDGSGDVGLDPAFGNAGAVTTEFFHNASSSDQAQSLVLQPDGKMVVAGDYGLVRYNPNGSKDISFGYNGVVTFRGYATSVALQSDGKIVVAGYSYNGSNNDFAVARYNADGTPDTTFDSDGILTAAIVGSSNDYARSVAVQSDGKIVVAGSSYNGSNDDFAVARYNADGTPDTTFDSDGVLTTGIGSQSDGAQSVAVQSDGKIVVAGTSYNGSNYDFAVARYNADGTPDTTFDSDGILTTAIGSQSDGAQSVAVQSDGKIVVAGSSYNGSYQDFAVARYNADGTPDTTFDSDGVLTTAIGASHDAAQSVAVQSDGKIVVAGTRYNGSNEEFAVARYNADGTPDTTFDSDGILTTAIGSSNDQAQSVAVQSDGKIVVAGSSYNGSNEDFAVARYNADGTLDTTFGNDGILTTAIGSSSDVAQSVVVQSDGKIVVAGSSYNGSNEEFAVARYNADGTLDTTFDSDGILTTAIGSSSDQAQSVAVQSDGKIVVAGTSYNGSNYDFAVARYNADGTLDTTFDSDGVLTTAIGSSRDYGQSVVVQSDGKIVVAGYSDNGSNYDFAVARYNADGTPDTTFSNDGILTTAIGSSSAYARSVAVQSDGKIVVAGYSDNGSNYDFAVARYNADGTPDTTFDSDGVLTTAIGASHDAAQSVVVQSDGKIVVAGYSYNGSSYDFAVVRYNADGSPDTSFDSDGVMTTAIGSSNDIAQSVAVQSDGKIVVAGYSYNGSNYDFAVIRISSGTTAVGLMSASGRHWDVDGGGHGTGQLLEGTDSVFDGINRLQIGGVDFAPTASATFDDARQTVVTDSTDFAGLNAFREITVPSIGSDDFAQTIEVLENTTGADITTTVRIVGNLGSDGATEVFGTSSGDTAVEVTDQWIGTDDSDESGSPAIVHFIHGPGGLLPSSVDVIDDNIVWKFVVTVPAHETVRLMTLTILADAREDAVAAAENLVTAAGFGGQAAAFLTPEERDSLANFQFQADVEFSAAAASDLEATGSNLPKLLVDGVISEDQTIDVTITGGSADVGDDFTLTTSVTIPAGTYDGTLDSAIDVPIIITDESIVELDETIELTLANPSAGLRIEDADGDSTIQGTHTYTITNDDAASFTIEAVTVNEGDTATFTVSLDHPIDTDVIVDIDFTDGTASAADDASAPQIVTFAAGTTTAQTFTVATTEEDLVELTETFTAALSTSTELGSRTVTASDSATGTIIDDDAASFTIESVTVNEGETATFTVSLDHPIDTDVIVDIDFTNGTASAADYASAAQIVTFAAGTTTAQTFTVATTEEDLVELTEAFTAALSTSTEFGSRTATASDSATGTIIDDDAASFTIESVTVNEGDTATFTVSLDHPIDTDVIVDIDFTNGTASAADYASGAQIVTFAAGTTTAQTFTVATTEEDLVELTESFTAALSTSTEFGSRTVTASDSATGTIIDDDAASFTIEAVTVNEGETAKFTVSLDHPIDTDVIVDIDFTNGTASAADYASAPQIVTFAAGTTTAQTFTVATTEEDLVELTEAFTAALSTATDLGSRNVTASDSATGTIIDDDTASFTIESVTVNEGDTATFTVSLDHPIDTDVIVDIDFTDGTATAADYASAPQIVTFAAGTTTAQTFTVATTEEDLVELTETFTAALSTSTELGSRNATASDSATGTIIDDDAASFTIEAVTINEGETATFTVSLDHPIDTQVVLDIHLNDGTATGGVDFDDALVQLTFDPSSITAQTFDVAIMEDAIDEMDEDYGLLLDTSTDLGTRSVTFGTATGTILDDDEAGFVISPVDGLYVTEAGGTSTVTIQLTSEPTAEVTVQFSSTDATEGLLSIDGVKYAATASLTFDASNWDQPQSIAIQGQDDDRGDGTIEFAIQSDVSSDDPFYDAFPVADLPVISLDDEPVISFSHLLDGYAVVDLTDVTPDGIVIFAWGTEPGSTFLPQFGVTLDIANPTLISLAEGGIDGTTSGVIPVPFTMEGDEFWFQAFEIAPNPQVSNVLPLNIVGSPVVVTANNLAPEPTAELPNFTATVDKPFDFDIVDDPFVDPDSDTSLFYNARQSDGSALPEWLTFDPNRLAFHSDSIPESGQWSITVTATDNGSPVRYSSTTFVLQAVADRSVWQNESNSRDVNGDDRVEPIDALLILNRLNRSNDPLLSHQRVDGASMLDVNGDQRVTPVDALQVINWLNKQNAYVAAELPPSSQLPSKQDEENDEVVSADALDGNLYPDNAPTIRIDAPHATTPVDRLPSNNELEDSESLSEYEETVDSIFAEEF
ncbi:Serine-aspartate repeat-containing protein D precursor [Rosistilla carotiformis]|uniref:Serine-aspartate repeat-containing protein D n=1 Tax=Rosistilla carotiformis TaxID=2528017 RepID=A0A518JSW8_9BACT|nr:Calx-beta domain-containing protein [Rosistilla carotiformis]QDV68641.1 Serine-aspartate repeat-containing protein D precursor [Rosistilla carotiformis]